MEPSVPIFFFDYTDPVSYLLDRELAAVAASPAHRTPRRVPLELCVPPAPLLDPGGPAWRWRWDLATEVAEGEGIRLAEPVLVPWTRKAHELALHARAKGFGEPVHRAVFEAVFVHGRDVGRVDVLVGLAATLGLDPTETKVVLDVDRFSEEVAAGRATASRAGITEPPALLSAHGTLQGFHNRDALFTFLLR
jgi:predicted DsbA family dithiol-disulfide isomerase